MTTDRFVRELKTDAFGFVLFGSVFRFNRTNPSLVRWSPPPLQVLLTVASGRGLPAQTEQLGCCQPPLRLLLRHCSPLDLWLRRGLHGGHRRARPAPVEGSRADAMEEIKVAGEGEPAGGEENGDRCLVKPGSRKTTN